KRIAKKLLKKYNVKTQNDFDNLPEDCENDANEEVSKIIKNKKNVITLLTNIQLLHEAYSELTDYNKIPDTIEEFNKELARQVFLIHLNHEINEVEDNLAK